MNIRFLGDVHGKIQTLAGRMAITSSEKDTFVFQLGDMAIGFPNTEVPSFERTRFGFIRGNHDNPYEARKHPNYLGEWGFRKGIFFVSGAHSIDKEMRVKGVDWWEQEELDQTELIKNVLPAYRDIKPEIIATHECPAQVGISVLNHLLDNGALPLGSKLEASRTSRALQMMFNLHQPKHWYFGHYHVNWDTTINGTEFHCLDELCFSAPLTL